MCERHILWEGRYPSPKKRSEYPKEFGMDNVNDWANTYLSNEDIKSIRNIINLLKGFIEENIFK